jgi:hypothetical protein
MLTAGEALATVSGATTATAGTDPVRADTAAPSTAAAPMVPTAASATRVPMDMRFAGRAMA